MQAMPHFSSSGRVTKVIKPRAISVVSRPSHAIRALHSHRLQFLLLFTPSRSHRPAHLSQYGASPGSPRCCLSLGPTGCVCRSHPSSARFQRSSRPDRPAPALSCTRCAEHGARAAQRGRARRTSSSERQSTAHERLREHGQPYEACRTVSPALDCQAEERAGQVFAQALGE